MFDLTHGFLFFLIGCTGTFVGVFIAYMVASRSQEKPRELSEVEIALQKLNDKGQ